MLKNNSMLKVRKYRIMIYDFKYFEIKVKELNVGLTPSHYNALFLYVKDSTDCVKTRPRCAVQLGFSRSVFPVPTDSGVFTVVVQEYCSPPRAK